MAEYIIQEETLTEIADAIRGKTGNENAIKAGEMASAISQIHNDATATSNQILTGYKAYGANVIEGSMANQAAISKTLTTQNESYTIPAGYHNGNGKINVSISGLAAENIRNGATIGGINGLYKGEQISSITNIRHTCEAGSDFTYSTYTLPTNWKIILIMDTITSSDYEFYILIRDSAEVYGFSYDNDIGLIKKCNFGTEFNFCANTSNAYPYYGYVTVYDDRLYFKCKTQLWSVDCHMILFN